MVWKDLKKAVAAVVVEVSCLPETEGEGVRYVAPRLRYMPCVYYGDSMSGFHPRTISYISHNRVQCDFLENRKTHHMAESSFR